MCAEAGGGGISILADLLTLIYEAITRIISAITLIGVALKIYIMLK